MRLTIHCCKDCIAPKRHQGCHATCQEYIKEKAQLEKDKDKFKADMKKVPSFSAYDFDEIAFSGSKRYKKRVKN